MLFNADNVECSKFGLSVGEEALEDSPAEVAEKWIRFQIIAKSEHIAPGVVLQKGPPSHVQVAQKVVLPLGSCAGRAAHAEKQALVQHTLCDRHHGPGFLSPNRLQLFPRWLEVRGILFPGRSEFGDDAFLG